MKDLVSFVQTDKIKEGEYVVLEREREIGGGIKPEWHI